MRILCRAVNNMAAVGAHLRLCLVLFLTYTSLSSGQDLNETTSATTITSTTVPTTTTTTERPTEAPTAIPPNTDIGVCTCDLTANGCDVNCCCDRDDCSTDDIQAFSTCIDKYTPSDSQTCIKRNIILVDNSPFEKNETDPNLLCIVVDNYKERNYYIVPNLIEDPSQFDEYLSRYGGPSYKSQAMEDKIPKDFYKSGDPILTLYESLVLGMLGLPRPLTSQQCSDTNPTAFLIDETFECTRSVTGLQKECTTTSTFDANTYFTGFKIIKTPKSFEDIQPDNDTLMTTLSPNGTTDGAGVRSPIIGQLQDLYNSSLVLPILLDSVTCVDRTGLTTDCNSTSAGLKPWLLLDADTWYCQNVVTKVEYQIEQNGTDGISYASVRFTLSEISTSNLPLRQSFTAKFTSINEGETFERSGNPGYQIGRPLLAGQLVEKKQDDGTIIGSIELDSNPDNWLTMLTSSVTGDCLREPTARVPVTFGENMRSGCTLSVTYNNLTADVCQLLQDAIKTALLGYNYSSHIATFGNSLPEKTGDWLEIAGGDGPTGSGRTTQPGRCINLVLGMHLEVLYSNVGALGNPQAKVIGVTRRWAEGQDVVFRCTGPYCQPGTESTLRQSIEVVSSVEFIDVSVPAVGKDAETPRFTARLPEDFFYPFT